MEIFENEIKPQRALLVSVDTGEYDAQASLSELFELAQSAGAETVTSVTQKKISRTSQPVSAPGVYRRLPNIAKTTKST